jgi:hypothetical protein
MRCVYRGTPFLLSMLIDSVEIHDEATLTSLQRISITGTSPTTTTPTISSPMCMVSVTLPQPSLDHALVCAGGDTLVYLRMVPLSNQVYLYYNG